MRVLLVRPPRRDAWDLGLAVPPLGLAYLAAALREAGHRVAILDARAEGLSWGAFEARVADARPELVGITAASPVRDLAVRAVRTVRAHARWVVLGGPHPTAVGAAVFEAMPRLDASVEGEAEETGPALLAWLTNGACGDPPAGVRIPGRGFRPRPAPARLDALPHPARDLLPGREYHHLLAPRRPMATLITSRGCPHACTFCDRAVGGRAWRARSARHVLEEVELLAATGVRSLHLYDDNFTHDRARVEAICAGLSRRGTSLAWTCEARVDGVDLPLLRRMRRAGCRLVAFGVESASDRTLASLRKGFDRRQVEAAFEAARAAGVRTLAYVILGAPGEGAAQVDATLRFVRHIRADFVQFSTLAALPGAPLGVDGGTPQDVRSFLDTDAERAVLSDIPSGELARWLRRAWGGYYLRPGPLSRLARAALRSGSWIEGPRVARVAATWALRR